MEKIQFSERYGGSKVKFATCISVYPQLHHVRFCNANTVSKVVGLGTFGSWMMKIRLIVLVFCKSGKKVFTRVVWSKSNFLLYCMFDT